MRRVFKESVMGEGYFEKVCWEKGVSGKCVGRRVFSESVIGSIFPLLC